jgi:GntR family transcriptional repressor for pyruvate dehydrogenase complex
VRLHEIVAQRLEDQILSGAYEAGDTIPPAHTLAKEYGVSLTVVRQAIHTLAGKGLVQARQGVGTVVTSDGDVNMTTTFRLALRRRRVSQREVAELWGIIETGVAALAARRRTEEDLSHMREILDELSAHVPNGSWDHALALRARFLGAIMVSTHNRAILTVLEPLLTLVNGSSIPDESTGSADLEVEQHRRIYECVASGDAAATCVAMEQVYGSLDS